MPTNLERGLGETLFGPAKPAGDKGMGDRKTKTVLHVFNYFKPDFTGEGIYVTNLLPLLERRGVRSDFLVKVTHPGDNGRVVRESEPVPHAIHYLSRSPRLLSRELRIPWWILLRGRRYDIVHFHSFCDRYCLALLIARVHGCRVLHSCTLDDSAAAVIDSYRPRWRGLVRWLFKRVYAFISISPKLFDEGKPVLRDGQNRMIPQGVTIPPEPQPNRAVVRRELGLGEDDLALLFVGAICERKNVHFLVENMAKIREKHPKVKLFIVGPVLEDDYAADVDRMIDDLGLEDCVELTGFVEDPTPYYALADLMVFSSLNEGFGNVLLEGMAHALPLVVRRLPGVTDYFIDHGRTGLLFDDEPSYLDSVNQLLLDTERRRSLGQAARTEVQAKFGLDVIADRYVELYNE